MSENERATRAQRIDPKLRSAGWPVIDPDIDRVWPSPASPAAVVEYETTHGPADYALCQPGSVQAVVETKKMTVGEYRRCEQALSQAEDCFSRIDSDDSGAQFFSPTQLGRLAGSRYLFLGHPERAEPILKSTAEALHFRPKTRSLVLGNLAANGHLARGNRLTRA
ncbi:MAG: hypothetical protein ACRDTA_16505 [Pseudonocardiaceae bacterium]